tara:strand:+ start:160 stop:480 length:321 start_codon:yes stop_codon:yes gene_type:complete
MNVTIVFTLYKGDKNHVDQSMVNDTEKKLARSIIKDLTKKDKFYVKNYHVNDKGTLVVNAISYHGDLHATRQKKRRESTHLDRIYDDLSDTFTNNYTTGTLYFAVR